MVEMQFEDFLKDISPVYHQFVCQINDYLLQNGCKTKFETAKNGCLVSYQHIKTKRVILNFVFRKSELHTRIYADNLNDDQNILKMLPNAIIKIIEKSLVCKRHFDPAACNARCPMGYVFTLNGTVHKKCRYNCFLLPVVFESMQFIQAVIENEIIKRAA